MKCFFGLLITLVIWGFPEVWAQEILFPLGTSPVYTLVRPGNNEALVVARDSRTLYVVDLDEAAPTTTPIALDRDGEGMPILDGEGRPVTVLTPLAVAVNEVTGRAVVVNFGSDNVSIVNLGTRATEAVVPVGSSGSTPRSVAIDSENNVAIVTHVSGNSISLLDLNTNTPVLPAPTSVGQGPIGVVYDEKNDVALVANHGAGTVSTVFYNLEEKIALTLRNLPVGNQPREIVLSPELGRAAVALDAGRGVAVLDTTTGSSEILGVVSLNGPSSSVAINPKTNFAAALLKETGTFALIDLATLKKLTTPEISLGANPVHLAVNPNNNTLLVAIPSRDAVVVVPMGFVNYFPLVSDTSEFRTNLGIRNLGEQEATVAVSWGNQDGVWSNERSAKVGPRGFIQINHVLRFVAKASSVTNISGTLRVVSDLPINSFISLIDNNTQDPALQVGVSRGSPRLLLSSSTNTGRFRTKFIIMNLGSISAAARVRARDKETGEEIGLVGGIQIPPNGYHVTEDIISDLGLGRDFGPLEIDSPTAQPMICVALITSTERTGGFLVAVPIDLPLSPLQ